MGGLATKTSVDLGWPRLLAALEARCRTPMGLASATSIELLDDREAVRDRLAEVAEARRLEAAGAGLPLDGFVDVRRHLERARRQAALEASELIDVMSTVGASRRLAAHLAERRVEAPRLARLVLARQASDAAALRDLEELLEACFEEDGSLADDASPELAVLRAQVRSLRERLGQRVQELLDEYEDVLQDRYYTVRDDRYVLPVRTDAHRRVHGIVHGHSGSGQTIYLEPREITDLGNDLVIAQTEVAREEARVLAQLSEEVRLRADLVEEALEAARVADLRSAAARLADRLEASAPELSDDEIVLRNVRHPLLVLDRDRVVPNDVTLRAGRVLVVSGPNGGGKTVALKTVGLVLLMVRAGLPVPAGEDSVLPVARHLWTDMGDDQSLEQSLSSFAAHMENIAAVLAAIGPGDVALLDELAGGTDPTEGAALAAEIARALADRGAAVMCTTHYGSLKLMALSEEGFDGASLGFDRESLSPTFRLAAGAPGVSGALAAARRHGLPEQVVEAARARMGEEGQRLAALLEELEAERERARKQADALVEERTAVDRIRRAIDAERAELRKKAREQLDKEARDLLEGLRAARAEVARVEEQLKRRRTVTTAGELKDASRALGKVASSLGPGGALAPALRPDEPPGRPGTDEELEPGTRVFVPGMGAPGTVAEPPRRGKVKVSVGRVTVTVAARDLRLLDGPAPAPPKPAPFRARPETIDAAGDPELPAMTPDNTLDLRGERVDDGLREAEKFIDRALQRGWTNAFFIHGHGTGALRDALRRRFDESPEVERWQPGERRHGGEGVTVVWLAG